MGPHLEPAFVDRSNSSPHEQHIRLLTKGLLMELATPITIYWDLPPGARDSVFLQRISADISDSRPLMLQLYVPDLQPGDELFDLLDHFKGTRIAVSLTIPAVIFQTLTNTLLDLGLKELLLSAECLDDLVEGISAITAISSKSTPGISFMVTCDNWGQLPRLVSLCRKEGIQRLVLPMQRLYHSETPFFITNVEQQELTDSLAEAGGVEGLNLTIHDPFLWRAFNPGIPFPQAGCQAANTMIAIASDGGVYPCPALPVRLGSIGEMSLKEIISSPAKKEFRRSLLKAPGECCDCAEIAVCRGGCRGRGLMLKGSLNGLDVACK